MSEHPPSRLPNKDASVGDVRDVLAGTLPFDEVVHEFLQCARVREE